MNPPNNELPAGSRGSFRESALKSIVEKYWVAYYIVYVGSVVFLLWRHWEALRWDNESYILLLAAIFGMSAGIASVTAIIVEVTGKMVLLIPDAIRKIKQEGRQEGRQEGQQEAHRQWLTWNERRLTAERDGHPFTEPPPIALPSKSGK